MGMIKFDSNNVNNQPKAASKFIMLIVHICGMFRKFGPFCLFLIIQFSANAQTNSAPKMGVSKDSLGASKDSGLVEFKRIADFFDNEKSMERWRETIQDFQVYNPVFRNQTFNSSLGNLGTPIADIFPNSIWRNGFNAGINRFEDYLLTNENVLLFDARTPYTRLQYNLGAQQEQYFQVIHTQNVGKQFNFGTRVNKLNSLGNYLRQATDHSNAQIHAWYRSKNNRYQVVGTGFYNAILAQENGGITPVADSLFVNNLETNRKVFPVNLRSARSNYFSNGGSLTQFYSLFQLTDSLQQIKTSLRILQEYSYRFERFSYTDDDVFGAYYQTVFDSTQTSNTYFHHRNKLGTGLAAFQKIDFLKAKLSGKIMFENHWHRVYSNQVMSLVNMDTQFRNDALNFSAMLTNDSLYQIFFESNTFLSGFNKGNNRQQLKGSIQLNQVKLEASLFSVSQNTDWINYRFSSNYATFANDFQAVKEQGSRFEGYLFKNKLSLAYQFRNINNWVYRTGNGLPQVTNGNVGLQQIELNFKSSIKKIHFATNYRFQQVSNFEALPLPKHQLRQNIYFEKRLSNNMVYQVGFDFWVVSGFQALTYRPELISFVNRPAAGKPIVMADVYVNVLIKRARVFVKFDHFNSGLFGYNYQFIANQPLTDRGLRFGISWAFFD